MKATALRRLLIVAIVTGCVYGFAEQIFAEHIGKDLCPPDTATHTAVKSGSWQEQATWDNGIPPAGAKVLIPAGLTVTNHATTADVLWIHVAGTLNVCDHCDTQINVHTMFVPMGGAVQLGMPTMPAQGKTVLEFVPGPFLPGDWQQLSLGLICHGGFMACGETKTAWKEVIATAAPGAGKVTLADYVYNWQPGDRILIAGTDSKVGEKWVPYQSEFRTIKASDGRKITLDAPLTYKHFRWTKGLKYHVANLTRNVVIRSRETEPISHRGHLMFMSSMVDMREVAMEGLGRTDKSKDVTDPRKDANGNLIPGSDANPRARYAWHVHRAGPMSDPAHCIGCVVDGSPGWGFLNHASHCKWHRCIAVRCYGAGFATEEGQERGYMRQCLSAMNHGMGDAVKSTDSDHGKPLIGDWGKDGSGFWLQGGMMEVSDCVSFDNSGRGFGLFNRTLNGYPDYGSGNPIAPLLQYPIIVDPSLLEPEYAQTQWWTYRVSQGKPPNIPSSAVPIQVFKNNVAYGNKVGLQAWAGIHDNNNLGLYWPLSIRGSIENLTLWGRGAKLHCEYLRQCNIDRVKIVGDLGFRSKSNTISNVYEAMLFRSPEVTVTNWSVENMACPDYTIVGTNDPGGIAGKNIVIEGR